MKANYSILLLNFIISVFMFLSLNSFSDSTAYLPVLFLYFSSNIATFIDKYIYYKEIDLFLEKFISLICSLLCIAMVCIYISDSLGFTRITFHNVSGIYRMLIQGVPNSFFTFNSIDITLPTFFIAASIPLTYLFYCASSYLREIGLTRTKVIRIFTNNKKKTLFLIFLSLILGQFGVCLCHYKYQISYEGFGEPQYLKYLLAFSLIPLFMSLYILLVCNKDKVD